MRWDPEYVYVDSGEEFRRLHAATYPDGDTPTLTLGCAIWALQYLLDTGGSAYLPERLIAGHVAEERLHVVPRAPVFTRKVYLITYDYAAANWPWLSEIVPELAS